MKSITEIDKNFAPVRAVRDDIKWINCFEKPFEINGLYRPYETGRLERFPEELQNNENINEGCRLLSKNTSGGRIRFCTDSPFVAVKVELACGMPMVHMPSTGHSGIDVYIARKGHTDFRYVRTFAPEDTEAVYYDGLFLTDRESQYGEFEMLLNLPLYNSVNSLFIGIKEGSKVSSPVKFAEEKPIVFYGSSITQGGCASRPGNNYMNYVARRLNYDFVNLGFSGSAMGEIEVAKFIASMDISAFVLDYDHNAPDAAHLRRTHYPFYETVRRAHPDIPIVMISAPVYYRVATRNDTLYGESAKDYCDSNAAVMESYVKAFPTDKNLYYLDGSSCFTGIDSDACTVDGCHPNDLGFYRMAEALYPVLKRALIK